MSKIEIVNILLSLINNELKMTKDILTLDDLAINLFGKGVGLRARDMMVLYFEVEKKFSINITCELFELHGFKTLNNIADIIYNCLNA